MRVFLRVYTNGEAYFTDVYIIIRVRACVCICVRVRVRVLNPHLNMHFTEVYLIIHGGGGAWAGVLLSWRLTYWRAGVCVCTYVSVCVKDRESVCVYVSVRERGVERERVRGQGMQCVRACVCSCVFVSVLVSLSMSVTVSMTVWVCVSVCQWHAWRVGVPYFYIFVCSWMCAMTHTTCVCVYRGYTHHEHDVFICVTWLIYL